MTRGQVLAAAAALLLPLVACGKKGPPLAPLRSVPGPPTDLAARRAGEEMQIRFSLPTQNVTPAERVDLGQVDIYAVTVAPGGAAPPARELVRRQNLVKTVPVRPLPEEEQAEEQPVQAGKPAAPAVKDDRPLPGDRVTFVEQLTAAVLRPTVVAKPPAPGKAGQPVPAAALDPPVATRYYLVIGRNHGGDTGAPSSRIALPLVDEPAAPSNVQIAVTEAALTIAWTPPPATVDPVAAAAHAHAWAVVNAPVPPPAVPKTERSAATAASATPSDPAVLAPVTRLPGVQLPPTVLPAVAPRFNVYAVKDGKVEDTPLNPAPLSVPTFAAGQPAWNEETCFAVRTVHAYGVLSVESAPTEPACATPRDTFPPAAPAGLRAVAVAGAMNLIWDASQEADLAGYLVLRGEAPGETLQPLTKTPIAETSYQDTTVQPGVRYVYAVVAIDRATPSNTSAQSARVEEVAR